MFFAMPENRYALFWAHNALQLPRKGEANKLSPPLLLPLKYEHISQIRDLMLGHGYQEMSGFLRGLFFTFEFVQTQNCQQMSTFGGNLQKTAN